MYNKFTFFVNTYADKTQQNKSVAIANVAVQKRSSGKAAHTFVDNRPKAIAQRKSQEAINNSPRVQQLKAYRSMTVLKGENNTGLPDEKHLPHKAGHVVQKQEGVKPVSQMGVIQMVSKDDYSGKDLQTFLLIKNKIKDSRSGYSDLEINRILAGVPISEMNIIISWGTGYINSNNLKWNINALDILKSPSRFSPPKGEEAEIPQVTQVNLQEPAGASNQVNSMSASSSSSPPHVADEESDLANFESGFMPKEPAGASNRVNSMSASSSSSLPHVAGEESDWANFKSGFMPKEPASASNQVNSMSASSSSPPMHIADEQSDRTNFKSASTSSSSSSSSSMPKNFAGFGRTNDITTGGQLITQGLANCIAIVAYNQKHAIMAHFDTLQCMDGNKPSKAFLSKFKNHLAAELKKKSPHSIEEPKFCVSMGSFWSTAFSTNKIRDEWMKRSEGEDIEYKNRTDIPLQAIFNICKEVFNVAPDKSGSIAIFDTIEKTISAHASTDDKGWDEGNSAGEEIKYSEITHEKPPPPIMDKKKPPPPIMDKKKPPPPIMDKKKLPPLNLLRYQPLNINPTRPPDQNNQGNNKNI